MTWRLKPASLNTERAAAVVLNSEQMLSTAEVAQILGLRPDTAQRHLSMCRKAGQVVLVGGTRWARPDVGQSARDAIHAAAKERRRLARLEIAASKRRQSDLTFKQQFRASDGKPVQRVRQARAGDAVLLGPNSVFALAAGLT